MLIVKADAGLVAKLKIEAGKLKLKAGVHLVYL